MVFDEIAQVSPCFLRVGNVSGPVSSTEPTPKALVTSHSLSSDHFSPADMKHQPTTDCLTLPLRAAFSSADASPAAARAPTERASRRVNRLDMAAPWGEGGTAVSLTRNGRPGYGVIRIS